MRTIKDYRPQHAVDCAAIPVTISGPGSSMTAAGPCTCGLDQLLDMATGRTPEWRETAFAGRKDDDDDEITRAFVAGFNAPKEILRAESLVALKIALAHVSELRDAWQRGAIREIDNLGGTRSNRNVDVESTLIKAISLIGSVSPASQEQEKDKERS